MKFIVSRTIVERSWTSHHKNPQCDEAKEDSIICTESYWKGCPSPVYTIELESLDDLMSFVNKYGQVMIHDHQYNKSYKEIEIYEDYRE